jgi:hypothetical protein
MLSRETFQNTTVLAVCSAIALGFISWSGIHIYVYFCAHSGITGFLQSLVTMDSSLCQALLSLVTNSQLLYSATISSLLVGSLSFIISCCAKPTKPR